MVVNENQIYKYGYLTFIINGKDIIIKTSLNQTFYLLPNGYWTPRMSSHRMSLIRNMVTIGEIRDWNELASYTRPGITWTPTFIKYEIVR